jgi:hypothetical protein
LGIEAAVGVTLLATVVGNPTEHVIIGTIKIGSQGNVYYNFDDTISGVKLIARHTPTDTAVVFKQFAPDVFIGVTQDADSFTVFCKGDTTDSMVFIGAVNQTGEITDVVQGTSSIFNYLLTSYIFDKSGLDDLNAYALSTQTDATVGGTFNMLSELGTRSIGLPVRSFSMTVYRAVLLRQVKKLSRIWARI